LARESTKSTNVQRTGVTIDLMKAEVPEQPDRGDVITIGSSTYVVNTATPEERDLIWRCDVNTG
jgi:hypothetical protein